MTNLKRWDPSREMDDFMNRFSRFSRAFGGPTAIDVAREEQMTSAQWSPAVDISETPEAYSITAEIPDVKKEDVKVTLSEGVLSLTGERRVEKEEKTRKFHRIERSFGRFERSFALPAAVDEQKIVANFKDGVLNVMVPKLAQSASVREVKIG